MTTPDFVAALLQPRAWPHPVTEPRLIETHISWVILTGIFAYKLKKPVNLEFLDFSTLHKRRHFCEEELRINRRFASDLYLDIVPIAASAEGPVVGGAGEPVEWALRMRQFPAGAVLAERDDIAAIGREVWRRFGADLARLQQTLPFAREHDPEFIGTPAATRDAVMQSIRQARVYLREQGDVAQLNRIEENAWADYRALEPFMWRRHEAGHVRECHGDLHLGNIALIDGRAVPFDAVEFNAAFRWIDVMNELAFLVMDCESRGIGGVGFLVLNAWLEHSGDYAGLRLLRFFLAYRAMVRAKVALLIGKPPVVVDSAAHLTYRRYAALAEACRAPGPRFLAITCGVSGSGKSTLAETLAAELRVIRVRSDVERKRLYGLAPDASSRDTPLAAALYSREAGARTFARLEELATQILADGYAVIVDATFIRRGLRQRFRALAATLGVPFHILFCDQPATELRRRVALREQQGDDASEAGLAVLDAQLRDAELPDAATEPETLRIGDTQPETIARLARMLV